MTKGVRNVLIILGIALVILVVPGGGNAAAFVTALLSTIFFAGLAWFCARLYREHRLTLDALTDRQRLVVYAAIGVVVLVATATSRLWGSGVGTAAWLVLIVGACYAVYAVYRASRTY